MHRRLWILAVVLAIVGILCEGRAVAQSQPLATSGPSAGPAADANRIRVVGPTSMVAMDPNRMRYWSDPNQLSLKDLLGATDEEWPVMRPRITTIQSLLAQLKPRKTGMSMGSMGGMGNQGDAKPSAVQDAYQALDKVVANKGTDGEIKSALQTLREAKAKVRSELEKAQRELTELVSVRQEALLKQMGVFD